MHFIPVWKEYEYISDGFAISAPVKPSLLKNLTNIVAGEMGVRQYLINLGSDMGITVGVDDHSNREDLSPDFLQRIKMIYTLQQGKLLSEKSISLDNNPGIEFELLESDGYHARWRYYLVGGRLISLASFTSQGRPLPPDTTRILDSFRLLKPR